MGSLFVGSLLIELRSASRNLGRKQELETMLAELRAYRQADPDFEMAINAFATSEAEATRVDPVDGVATHGLAGSKTL